MRGGGRTLLVPVDFSECSFEVVRHAAELARGLEADVRLLHVVHTPEGISLEQRIAPDNGEGTELSIADYLAEDAWMHLQHYLKMEELSGLNATAQVAFYLPAERILTIATDMRAHMIVMGTHARSGMARALLGSVAEEVTRRASCPVVTVRAQHRPSCVAKECDYCWSGVTAAQRRVLAQLDH